MKQLLLLTSAAAFVIVAPSLAKPGNGNGHGNPHGNGWANEGPIGYGAGGCPPGLAKKHNGCLPPGQAKKLWVVGQPLPPAVFYEPVPRAVVQQLAPVPPGYDYVRVDNDVLLMDMTNRMVADVVNDIVDYDSLGLD